LWDRVSPIFKGMFLFFLKTIFDILIQNFQFEGLAFTAIIIDLFLAIFYNTVIAWAVYYFFASFNKDLPWKGCNNDWNTRCCYPISDPSVISTSNKIRSNSPQYFQKLNNSPLSDYFAYKLVNAKNASTYSRLTIFDTRPNHIIVENNISDSQSFKRAVNEAFKGSYQFQLNQSISSNVFKNSTNIDYKLEIIKKWINSYYVIINDTITRAPIPNIDPKMYAKFAHDPELFATKIEENIRDLHANVSTVILSCTNRTLSNPTQEYYTRELTKMHESIGLEDIGDIRWELVGCLFIVFLTVYFAVWKGVKSAGKVNRFNKKCLYF
jgi:hypothetical protein